MIVGLAHYTIRWEGLARIERSRFFLERAMSTLTSLVGRTQGLDLLLCEAGSGIVVSSTHPRYCCDLTSLTGSSYGLLREFSWFLFWNGLPYMNSFHVIAVNDCDLAERIHKHRACQAYMNRYRYISLQPRRCESEVRTVGSAVFPDLFASSQQESVLTGTRLVGHNNIDIQRRTNVD